MEFFSQLGLLCLCADVVIWDKIILWLIVCQEHGGVNTVVFASAFLGTDFEMVLEMYPGTTQQLQFWLYKNRKIFNMGFAVFVCFLHLDLYNFQVSLVLVISGVLCGREEGKRQFYCSVLLKTCK